MDWHSTLTRFEFLGGSSIEDLQASCDAIPEAAGVYILKRLSPTPVAFLVVNPGGHFKGRDPTVSVSRLEERWIPSADVAYIGKAGSPAPTGVAAASGSWRTRQRSECTGR